METPIEFIVAAFNEEEKASEVLKILKKLEKEQVIFLVNAAVMSKDKSGNVSLRETQDVSPDKGAIFGAIAGGLIGLLGGPIGAFVGATAGAAAGGMAAGRIDMGFPDDELKDIRGVLKPNSSAILALIQHQWIDTAAAELEKYGATLFRKAVKEELAAQLAKEVK